VTVPPSAGPPRDGPYEPAGWEPIRAVLFADPFLAASADDFVHRLREHPSIELLAVYCQGPGAGSLARLNDLWRRRGPLGLVIALTEAGAGAVRIVFRSGRHRRRREALSAIRVVPDLHASDILEQVRRLDPDLGLVYGGPILKPELFRIPKIGTLGIHHGRLPEYRGKKTTFWEMFNGEALAGITIQSIDAGIDTGRVIARSAVPIERKSYSRVWRDVQEVGVALFIDAVLRTAAGEPGTGAGDAHEAAPRKPGPLYRDPKPAQLLRFWLKRLPGRRRRTSEPA